MVDQRARERARRVRAKKRQLRRQRIVVFGGLAILLIALIWLISLFIGMVKGGSGKSEKRAGETGSGKENPSFSTQAPESHPNTATGQTEPETETDIGSTLTPEEKMQIIQTSPEYPEELVEFAGKYAEVIDYVYYYPQRKDERPVIDLSAEAASGKIPLLIQWDRRWGYLHYGDAFVGDAGCGPTCLSMAAIYITKNPNITPYVVADYSYTHQYRVAGSGTSWTLISEGCEAFGMKAEMLPLDENTMKMRLDAGLPIIVSLGPGDFTRAGHYIVLTGYDKDGFTINDPNSPNNSAKHWTYERLSGQILNLWAMSAK